ncbi:MAG: hypothetical protein EA423_11515 [Phycisphaerales bacterium]|nr:MAG: hypothetical protein EA423_11515 [Phycisphaerales bacterium]
MSSFPAGITRVPNLMLSQLAMGRLGRTGVEMARVQEQLATGLRVNRPSDDAVGAAIIAELNARLGRAEQTKRNLQHADSALAEADSALNEAYELLLQAKSIAGDQINFPSTADERAAQARIIDSIITGLVHVGNRRGVAGHIFGGSNPTTPPIEQFLTGFRFKGEGQGLVTDLGVGSSIPITLGPENALGSVSARVNGTRDLEPGLTPDTRLADMHGARGLGVGDGPIALKINGADPVTIDLANADTIGDVLKRIEAAIKRYETDNEIDLLGPGGVSLDGRSIRIDVLPAPAGEPAYELAFSGVGGAKAAADLGLEGESGPVVFDASSALGLATSPRLTMTTPLAALGALEDDLPLGTIRLRSLGRTALVDLSNAQSLQDVAKAIEGTGLGLRVRIDPETDRLMVVSEVSASRGQALSIEDADDSQTAGLLGIRSFDHETKASDLNFGRGVSVVSGATHPDTGAADPSRDIDFLIHLGDGTPIAINLSPSDTATVGSIASAIQAQLEQGLIEAGLDPAAARVELGTGPNGLRIVQDTTIPGFDGAIRVEAKNNSSAAFDLGLLGGEYDPGAGVLRGADVSKVRPENALTALMDLREALMANDTAGITFAGERLERALSDVADARGVAGAHARRVDSELWHLEDRRVVDETLRSDIRDTDFTKAATRMAMLQTQLQAGYQSTASMQNLSLLDFLG